MLWLRYSNTAPSDTSVVGACLSSEHISTRTKIQLAIDECDVHVWSMQALQPWRAHEESPRCCDSTTVRSMHYRYSTWTLTRNEPLHILPREAGNLTNGRRNAAVNNSSIQPIPSLAATVAVYRVGTWANHASTLRTSLLLMF